MISTGHIFRSWKEIATVAVFIVWAVSFAYIALKSESKMQGFASAQPISNMESVANKGTEQKKSIEKMKNQHQTDLGSLHQLEESRDSPQRQLSKSGKILKVKESSENERWREINGKLSEADRNRLSNALYEFMQFLDDADKLREQVGLEEANLNHEWQDGSIIDESKFANRKESLHNTIKKTKKLEELFAQIKAKWKYFPEQTHYIFPGYLDNDGPSALTNSIRTYLKIV